MSVTAPSNRQKLKGRYYTKLKRFLRSKNSNNTYAFPREVRGEVEYVLTEKYPDQGVAIVENYDKTNEEKIEIFCEWFEKKKQVTFVMMGDQGQGKDYGICSLIQILNAYRKKKELLPYRVCTLGNVKCPPFVFNGEDTDFEYLKKYYPEDFDIENYIKNHYRNFEKGKVPLDMYFSLRRIPLGIREQPVIIYPSEIESEFPSRESTSAENKSYSKSHTTFRQRKQKIVAGCKLLSMADLMIPRTMNANGIKFIDPKKLEVEGVERVGVITDLARWLMPKDEDDPTTTLLIFGKYCLTVQLGKLDWYDDDFSEQFANVPMDKIKEFIHTRLTFIDDKDLKNNELTRKMVNDIQEDVFGKFSTNISPSIIHEIFKEDC